MYAPAIKNIKNYIIDNVGIMLNKVSLYLSLLCTQYYYTLEYIKTLIKVTEAMINWKDLKNNPPDENCNICLKIGVSYDTYFFKRHNSYSWELCKYPRIFGPEKVPDGAQYINLDEIK